MLHGVVRMVEILRNQREVRVVGKAQDPGQVIAERFRGILRCGSWPWFAGWWRRLNLNAGPGRLENRLRVGCARQAPPARVTALRTGRACRSGTEGAAAG